MNENTYRYERKVGSGWVLNDFGVATGWTGEEEFVCGIAEQFFNGSVLHDNSRAGEYRVVRDLDNAVLKTFTVTVPSAGKYMEVSQEDCSFYDL